MQLSMPKVWCNVAKLDFRTPRAPFFLFWWPGDGQKSLLQPMVLSVGFMVAPSFNKEATISPPWSPMGSHGPHGPHKAPRKINIFLGVGRPAGKVR